MNKTHPRILILLLAVCLVLPLAAAFSGCRGKTGQGSSPTQAMRDPVTGEYAPIVSDALTGIYRPEETYRTEDGELDSVFVPYFDPETGALTAFSRTTEEIALTDENGEPIPPYTPEMNPIEQIWKYLRSVGFRNEIFRSLADVVDRLCAVVKTLANEIVSSITCREWIELCFLD